MKILIIGLVLFCSVSCCAEDNLRYDPVNNTYVYADTHDHLRYNAVENKYEYAGTNDKLRYNTMEDKYEYADSGNDE
jgi:hypothetical protein